jgi:hypothetical protein
MTNFKALGMILAGETMGDVITTIRRDNPALSLREAHRIYAEHRDTVVTMAQSHLREINNAIVYQNDANHEGGMQRPLISVAPDKSAFEYAYGPGLAWGLRF